MLDMDHCSPVELLSGESDDNLYGLTLAALVEWHETKDSMIIPRSLDEMPPGPFLGAILSKIDLTRLTGRDVVTVLRAQDRQSSHYRARVYATMAETAHCIDADTIARTTVLDEFAAEEIGAALTLTRRMANREMSTALELVDRLTAVHDALDSGDIDGRKASLIVKNLAQIEVEQARHIVDRVLVDAPRLTTGQLSARLRRMCVAQDPENAKTRFERSLSERKVTAEPNCEGTAALVITECSPDDVYAARDHINILARRLKTADEPRNIDQLRADVAIGLLNGTIGSTRGSRGSVDIHVDLTTLTEIADKPAELGGYGPVIAEIARKVAAKQLDAQWTATVTDPETGEPLHTVALRRRPTTAQRRRIRALHPICVFPGCRMPSTNCDLDHRIDHAAGGPTTVANHAPLCRRHHLTKHKRGWRYRKCDRTTIEWLSPLGHSYVTGRPP